MRAWSGGIERRRGSAAAAATAAAVAAALFFVTAAPGFGADRRIVRGIVGTVAGTRVFLGGASYDLAGVVVRNPSGNEVGKEKIVPGAKVDLVISGGTVVSAVVYEPMVE